MWCGCGGQIYVFVGDGHNGWSDSGLKGEQGITREIEKQKPKKGLGFGLTEL